LSGIDSFVIGPTSIFTIQNQMSPSNRHDNAIIHDPRMD
jgi:hypothetical protein